MAPPSSARYGGSSVARPTRGGVDLYGHTREQLYERTKRLGVRGASRMKKKDLARAIAKKQ